MQVHGPRTLARPELIRVGERILEQLHHRVHPGRLVLDALNRGALFTQIGEVECHPAPALGELERGVNRAGDGFHIVFHPQQETGDQFPARLLTGIEESGGGRLETPGDHLFHEVGGQLGIPIGQREGHDADPILETLQVAGAIPGFQGVGGVVLEGPHERGETELMRVGLLVELLNKGHIVSLDHALFVVAFAYEVLQFFFQVVEKHGVLIDVLEEVLPHGFVILLELDLALGVVQIELGIERVVIHERIIQVFRTGVR